jgi:GTP-binding protein
MGPSTGFALENLQKRGEMFVGIGEDIYEGMIVGEASRPEEMVVNPCRTKELTNIRTHSHDEAVKLTPPRSPTLETAIEWIADDELVEVTPLSIRIRKRYLAANERKVGRKIR